jgi:hypothetical protein
MSLLSTYTKNNFFDAANALNIFTLSINLLGQTLLFSIIRNWLLSNIVSHHNLLGMQMGTSGLLSSIISFHFLL